MPCPWLSYGNTKEMWRNLGKFWFILFNLQHKRVSTINICHSDIFKYWHFMMMWLPQVPLMTSTLWLTILINLIHSYCSPYHVLVLTVSDDDMFTFIVAEISFRKWLILFNLFPFLLMKSSIQRWFPIKSGTMYTINKAGVWIIIMYFHTTMINDKMQ